MFQNTLMRIASFFNVLVLICCVYGAFAVVYVGSNLAVEPKHAFLLPTDVQISMFVDARSEAIELAKEVMFSGTADGLILKMKTKGFGSGDSRTYGINWLMPIYYFQTRFEGKELQGMIVSIWDKQAWNADINKLFGNVSASVSIGTSGMVVQSTELKREDLYRFIQLHQLDELRSVSASHTKGLISLNSKQENVHSKLDLRSEGTMVGVNGELELATFKQVGSLHYQLLPEKFHFTSDLMAEQLRDSIQKTLGTDFPLSGMSFNFSGATIKEEDVALVPVPHVDLVLGFSRPFPVDSLLQFLPYWKWKEPQHSLVYGGVTFYVKQLDLQTLYIGQSQNPGLKEVRGTVGLVAKGSLKPLISIEGNSFVRMALSMNPSFSVLRDLSNKTNEVQLNIQVDPSFKLKIDGKVQFKEGKSATIGLLEMAVNKAL